MHQSHVNVMRHVHIVVCALMIGHRAGMAVTAGAMTVYVAAVTVRLSVIVPRRGRHMMIGAQRSVRRERECRHDRESGRETSAHR